MKKFFTSWSGGKDSCLATLKAREAGYTPVAFLNMLNEHDQISRSHAIPKPVLEKQALLAGVPLETRAASWNDYERVFTDALLSLRETYHVSHGVFGDIDLQVHRDWEEKVCNTAGITALLPLWQRNRKELVLEMIDIGMEARIVSCNEAMGPDFLGALLTRDLIDRLENLGVDPCGENGEYHTLVVNCPLFTAPMKIDFGATMKHDNYWFVSMALRNPSVL